MKITLDPSEQLARDIRAASQANLDFTLQVHVITTDRKSVQLIHAKLMKWTLTSASCKHETDTFETEWAVYKPPQDTP